ncbi:MAG TPA: hypothetical protein PLU37_00410 [Chitinophagaceae bacterium]|nr:hypothetical protein [Chitinophagaceae bacterium]HPG09960.1 hypothetical protein [Chitinophagaceae bacterium]HRX93320.1 hypothetical protein [Chitinophagaceae bacterium]
MDNKKSFVEKVYENLPDEELLSLAKNDTNDLTAEALEALTSELSKRGLKGEFIDIIKIQQKKFNQNEFLNYVNLIRTQPCPICFTTNRLLNSIIVTKIKRNILFSSKHKEFVIACPSCVKEVVDKSGGVAFSLNAVGLLFGTIDNMIQKHEMQLSLDKLKEESPSESLVYFVQKKIIDIELNKENPTKLYEIVRNANDSFF